MIGERLNTKNHAQRQTSSSLFLARNPKHREWRLAQNMSFSLETPIFKRQQWPTSKGMDRELAVYRSSIHEQHIEERDSYETGSLGTRLRHWICFEKQIRSSLSPLPSFELLYAS